MSWVTVGMQTQCSLSLYVGLEAIPDSGSSDWECSTAECATSMAWYGQQAERSRCMTTGDVWDWNAAVYQILRRFVLETSANCYTKLVPDPICMPHRASASRHVKSVTSLHDYAILGIIYWGQPKLHKWSQIIAKRSRAHRLTMP